MSRWQKLKHFVTSCLVISASSGDVIWKHERTKYMWRCAWSHFQMTRGGVIWNEGLSNDYPFVRCKIPVISFLVMYSWSIKPNPLRLIVVCDEHCSRVPYVRLWWVHVFSIGPLMVFSFINLILDTLVAVNVMEFMEAFESPICLFSWVQPEYMHLSFSADFFVNRQNVNKLLYAILAGSCVK